jgi:hypothetical protein
MKIKKVKIADLHPHPMNYNTHPDAQILQLEKSLDAFSQFKNIVVCQDRILAGHGLVEAAKRKGMKEIYALIRDDLDENQQKALLVADNALPFAAIPDTDILSGILESLPEDFEIPGVDDDWLAGLGGDIDVAGDDGDKKNGAEQILRNGFLIEIECESESEQQNLFNDLTEKGFSCRILAF